MLSPYAPPNELHWAALATHLGLVAHQRSVSYGADASFRQLKGALGAPAARPRFDHWLYGLRNGTEVLVANYTADSGDVEHSTWTVCVARIKPALLLGVDIVKRGMLRRLLGSQGLEFGIPEVDTALDVRGGDPEGLRALLWPRDEAGRQFLAQLAMTEGLSIKDSAVRIAVRGLQADPAIMVQRLESAVWIAQALAARRREMTPSVAELAQRAAWRGLVEAEEFRFDEVAMRIKGDLAGADIEMALATEGGMFTAVTCRFPRSVGVNVRLQRTGGQHFLDRVMGQDIQIGEPSFDALYVVQGQPEHAVRQLFSNAPLRMALSQLAVRAEEVTMNDTGLFFRVRQGVESDPAELVAFVRHVVTALFGEVQAIGPYR